MSSNSLIKQSWKSIIRPRIKYISPNYRVRMNRRGRKKNDCLHYFYRKKRSTMRNTLLVATVLLERCTHVSATAGPVFGEFCPRWMDSWLCNRNPTGHWLDNSCGEDSQDTQLEIIADFYFETGNRASSGPLFETGWLSDCEYCDWEGISCNDAGNIVAIEVGKISLNT